MAEISLRVGAGVLRRAGAYGAFNDLKFRTGGGTVTLFGDVTQPTLKDDGERIVNRIAGMEQVGPPGNGLQ